MLSGLLVIVKDDETGNVSLRRVIRTFVRQAAPIVAVTITTAAGASETFNTTEEHPFWVQDIGWIQAGDLQSGYAVRTTTGGTAGVWSVAFTGQRTKVYNLEVEGLHNYHVGTGGVLVHNPCMRTLTRRNFNHNLSVLLLPPGKGYQAHHIIPHRFQQLFPGRNLNDPATNGAWVHRNIHLGSGSITNEWETWARNNPNITAKDVLNFAQELESRAGLWILRP